MITLLPSLSVGVAEGLLLVGVVMLLFGAKKLPGIAKGLGTGIRNFKGELKNPDDEGGDGQ